MFTQKQFDDYLAFCKVNNYKQNRFYDNCFQVSNYLLTIDFSINSYIIFTVDDDDVISELLVTEDFEEVKKYINNN